MIHLICIIMVFTILLYFVVTPKRSYRKPPQNDDEGGEPNHDGLPDLDLPPGISRPINDWEPDHNRRPHKQPTH